MNQIENILLENELKLNLQNINRPSLILDFDSILTKLLYNSIVKFYKNHPYLIELNNRYPILHMDTKNSLTKPSEFNIKSLKIAKNPSSIALKIDRFHITLVFLGNKISNELFQELVNIIRNENINNNYDYYDETKNYFENILKKNPTVNKTLEILNNPI